MATEQRWGRKGHQAIIWPPRVLLLHVGSVFLALVLAEFSRLCPI